MADPTKWPPERRQTAIENICRRIAGGESLLRICSDKEMPARSVIYLWLKSDPDFTDRYKAALEEQADYFAEQALEIAESAQGGTKDDIQAARLMIDTLKWRASQQSSRWNARVEVEHTGQASVTFHFDLSGGQQKTIAHDPVPLLSNGG